jgi:hypothetical protein
LHRQRLALDRQLEEIFVHDGFGPKGRRKFAFWDDFRGRRRGYQGHAGGTGARLLILLAAMDNQDILHAHIDRIGVFGHGQLKSGQATTRTTSVRFRNLIKALFAGQMRRNFATVPLMPRLSTAFVGVQTRCWIHHRIF